MLALGGREPAIAYCRRISAEEKLLKIKGAIEICQNGRRLANYKPIINIEKSRN